jgi:hypothetical protein
MRLSEAHPAGGQGAPVEKGSPGLTTVAEMNRVTFAE